MGEIKNAPPTLEWVAVERLQVDAEYQRATDGHASRRIIYGMVKCWDWALCQPLVVSRREDGSLFVLDGQHRLNGARQRGDIMHLPCVILTGCSHTAEAEAFVSLNTKRQRLSQAELFNAMLAASDPEAVAVSAMIRETGWSIARTKNVAAWKPGQLDCAPMLTRQVKAFGEAPVRNALSAMREAYPDVQVTVASTLLRALIPIYRDNDIEGIDPDVFIETLGSIEPGGWCDEGRDYRRRNPALSGNEAIAAAMVKAARDKLLDEAA